MKAPQFILYVVFLICSSFLSKAQFISIDEARHKEVKAEKQGFCGYSSGRKKSFDL
jgi:hypothetical protein